MTAAPSTLAGMITAAATIITAVGGLVVAVGVLIPILRQTRDTKKQVEAVHIIVNQQRTDMQRYQRALVSALEQAGVTVPDDQSLPLPEPRSEPPIEVKH